MKFQIKRIHTRLLSAFLREVPVRAPPPLILPYFGKNQSKARTAGSSYCYVYAVA
jgi:hypothetical protein